MRVDTAPRFVFDDPVAPALQLVFPEPLRDLTRSCETNCVAGCCGVDAFVVSADSMQGWIRKNGRGQAERALAQLDDILEELRTYDGQVMSLPDDFNARWSSSSEATAYFVVWRAKLMEGMERP